VILVGVVGCGSDSNSHVDASVDSKHVDAPPQEIDARTGTQHLHAAWTIKTMAGVTQPCPGGFDTAAVYEQPIDAGGNPTGATLIDLFNCVDGQGVTAPLPPSRYLAWIEIATHDNSSQYAKSVSAPVDLRTADDNYDAQILTDGGYFQFAWNLTRASNGAALTCADVVNIGGVESISTEVGNPTNFASDIFNCGDGKGITAGFLMGTYTVHVDAIDQQMPPASIGDAPDLLNRVIMAPNKVTDLGTVTIPITAL
jgi:hypothetical protein